MRVTIAGGDKPASLVVSVVAPDSDGLGVQFVSSTQPLLAVMPGDTKDLELLIRVGQSEAPLQVSLRGDGMPREQQIELTTSTPKPERLIRGGMAATTRHLIEIAPTQSGSEEAFAGEQQDQEVATVVTTVADVAKLPRDALGYESIDTVVVVTAGDSPLNLLRPSDARLVALREWVEQGGKLLISCGENADVLFADDGALAGFVKANVGGSTTLDNPTPLEQFASGRAPIGPRGSTQITVARISDVEGEILVHAGESPTDMPLVVTNRLALGRVTLLACDLNTQPLRSWKDRGRLLRKLLTGTAESPKLDENGNGYYGHSNELADQLRSKLDNQLEQAGIRTPPFLAIAGLVFLYILLIGPFDYWLVKNVFKRMEATWITFPTMIVATCIGAYWLANYLKGDDQIVNQIEVVDVDTETGIARGTLWHHLFSPQPKRYNLTLATAGVDGQPVTADETALAWLGQTGSGLGRMGTNATPMSRSPSYFISENRDLMSDRPIQIWSTRTSVARWRCEVDSSIASDLTESSRSRLTGSFSNETSTHFSASYLIYGEWIWTVPQIKTAETIDIKLLADPISVNTFNRTEFGFESDDLNEYQRRQIAANLEASKTVSLMMFAKHFGADKLTAQLNRYQHFIDLSHSLDERTAMLVCRLDESRSRLLDRGNPLENAAGKQGTSLTYYRFLLPVASEEK